MNTANPYLTGRGATHILEHCARLSSQAGRPTAAARLEQSAGHDLTRLLLKALAGDHRARLA